MCGCRVPCGDCRSPARNGHSSVAAVAHSGAADSTNKHRRKDAVAKAIILGAGRIILAIGQVLSAW